MVEQQDAAARWVGQQRDKHEGAGRVSGSMNEDHVLLRNGGASGLHKMVASVSKESGTCAGRSASGRDENVARLAGFLTGTQIWSTRRRRRDMRAR